MTGPAGTGPAGTGPAGTGPAGAETRQERVERLYTESEVSLVGLNARRVRRGPETLIGVLLGVCLAVGIVASIDLRRLNSPAGAAQTWTGAAVFGDCAAYESLSTADPADGRSAVDRCRDLRARTAPNRQGAPGVEIEVLTVDRTGDRATVRVQVTQRGEVLVVPLPLARLDGHWSVGLTDEVCQAVGCA